MLGYLFNTTVTMPLLPISLCDFSHFYVKAFLCLFYLEHFS